MERWRPINGYESSYEVSDKGRVKSLSRLDNGGKKIKGKLLRMFRYKTTGYIGVDLCSNGSRKRFSVHRLVLSAFVRPCPKGMETCHNNGVRDNNRLENLRWDTRSNNHRDKLKHGTALQGSRHGASKLCELDVWLIRNIEGVTQRAIAKFFEIHPTNVSVIKLRKSWRHI